MRLRAFVYILRCVDGSLYTGYTVDLQRRLKQHQSGNGGRYTRTHLPVELVYAESFRTRREAMRREIVIKQLPRKKKLALFEGSTAKSGANKKIGNIVDTRDGPPSGRARPSRTRVRRKK